MLYENHITHKCPNAYSTPFWRIDGDLDTHDDLSFNLINYAKQKNRDWFTFIGPGLLAVLLTYPFPGLACYQADGDGILPEVVVAAAKVVYTKYFNQAFFDKSTEELQNLTENFRNFLVQISFDIVESNNAKLFNFILAKSPEFFQAFSLWDLQMLISLPRYRADHEVEAAIVVSIYRRFDLFVQELFASEISGSSNLQNNVDLITLQMLIKHDKLTYKDQKNLRASIDTDCTDQNLADTILTILNGLERKQKSTETLNL